MAIDNKPWFYEATKISLFVAVSSKTLTHAKVSQQILQIYVLI